MSVLSNEALLKQLGWRYATKKFDGAKKISDADWKALSESLRLSASSYGLQPWKFIVVQTPELRKKLRAASWNQEQVEECSHFVVFTTLKKVSEDYVQKFIELTAHERGIPVDKLAAYKKMMVGDVVAGPRGQGQSWAQKQAYIALGSLLLSAALLEIDACPMEGLDPAQYDQILGLTETPYATTVAAALGYRSAEDRTQSLKKVRFDPKEVIEYR